MRKFAKFIMATFVGTFLLGTTAYAEEETYVGFNVTPTSAVGYTNAETVVMTDATGMGIMILNAEQCPDAIPLLITGITDTGYWQVDLGQVDKYYILGPHLENIDLISSNVDENSGNGVIENNTTVNNDTVVYVDNDTALAIVQSGVSSEREEKCIQYLFETHPYALKTEYDIDMTRYFCREFLKLYEQAKANPSFDVLYRSVYYDNSLEMYAYYAYWYLGGALDDKENYICYTLHVEVEDFTYITLMKREDKWAKAGYYMK